MHFRHLPLVTAFILMLGSTFDFASADVFSVDEPEVVKGEQEIEVNAAVQNGFPVNADPVRYSMEVEYTYGVTKWLSLSPLVDFDKPDGDSFHAIVAGVESVWFPVEVGKLLTFAWFTEVEGAVTPVNGHASSQLPAWVARCADRRERYRLCARIAAEVADYSKTAFEDASRAFQQLVSAKSAEQAFEIQSQYAKKAYDAYVAQASKLGEMWVDLARATYKPVERAVAKKAA